MAHCANITRKMFNTRWHFIDSCHLLFWWKIHFLFSCFSLIILKPFTDWCKYIQWMFHLINKWINKNQIKIGEFWCFCGYSIIIFLNLRDLIASGCIIIHQNEMWQFITWIQGNDVCQNATNWCVQNLRKRFI